MTTQGPVHRSGVVRTGRAAPREGTRADGQRTAATTGAASVGDATRIYTAPPAATWSLRSLPTAPGPAWADRVAAVVARAAAARVSTGSLRHALRGSVSSPHAVDRALAEVDRAPRVGTAGLRDALLGCTVVGLDRLDVLVEALEDDVGRITGRTVVEQDTTTARVRWLHPDPAPGAPDRGRVVLLRTAAAQVGDDGTQVNVFVHEVDGPRVDLATFVRDRRVATALAGVAVAPDDPAARERVHEVVAELRPRSTRDWTAGFAAPGSTRSGAGAAALDGTVALVESRNVQVGDDNHQENRIVATISPTLRAAELLAHDADLVDALIDVATARGDGAAVGRFREAVENTLLTTMSEAPATTTGHGAVHRPPAPGRTLRIRRAEGVAVGLRVSQKNHHLQRVDLDRHVDRGAQKVAGATRRAVRRLRREPG